MNKKYINCSLCKNKYEFLFDDDDDANNKQGLNCDFSYNGFDKNIQLHIFSGGYGSNYYTKLYISKSNFGLNENDSICNDCVKAKIKSKKLIFYKYYM